MNINYCGYVQAIADYKKEHINPLPGVTKEHTLHYSGLFINDQVYKNLKHQDYSDSPLNGISKRRSMK